MSNEKKSPPRKPDLYVDNCRGGLWDNRKDGGDVKLSITITFKEVEQRLQDMKEAAADRDGERAPRERESGARDDERPAERREGARGDAREERSSNREDRRPRDAGPRYER